MTEGNAWSGMSNKCARKWHGKYVENRMWTDKAAAKNPNIIELNWFLTKLGIVNCTQLCLISQSSSLNWTLVSAGAEMSSALGQTLGHRHQLHQQHRIKISANFWRWLSKARRTQDLDPDQDQARTWALNEADKRRMLISRQSRSSRPRPSIRRLSELILTVHYIRIYLLFMGRKRKSTRQHRNYLRLRLLVLSFIVLIAIVVARVLFILLLYRLQNFKKFKKFISQFGSNNTTTTTATSNTRSKNSITKHSLRFICWFYMYICWCMCVRVYTNINCA